jgi:hypothetical protein
MNEVEFRLAKPSDKTAIADLLALSTSHFRPIRYWEWANTEVFFPGSFVVIATYFDRIVGHYAISVRDYNTFGVKIKVGVATQTVIHPLFRKLQILLDISNFVKDICLTKKLHLIIGFPNSNLYKINKKLLKWKHVSDVVQLEVDLNQLPTFNSKSNNKVHRAHEFSNEFNSLIEFNNNNNNTIAELLSVPNLNWRYFKHPLNHYIVFSSMLNNSINGYVVLKIYHSFTGITGHILDLLTYNNSEVVDSLFGAAIEYFKWANCKNISMWVGENNYQHAYIRNMGFKENSIKSHLQVLPLKKVYNELLDIECWNLLMGMSDAY